MSNRTNILSTVCAVTFAIGVLGGSVTTYAQCEVDRIVPTKSEVNPIVFGRLLSFSGTGNTMAVGTLQGLYVYDCISGSCTEVSQIDFPDSGNHRFNYDLSITDEYIVASDLTIPSDFPGGVFVFKKVNTNWVLDTRLTASDGEAGDLFGFSSDIQGQVIVVGAPAQSDSSSREGAVYVFQRINDSWVETTKLKKITPVENDEFGLDVMLHENQMIVIDDGESNKAFIYTKTEFDWFLDTEFVLWQRSDKILWNGDYIVASDSNNVELYTKIGNNWEYNTTLITSDGRSGDQFGTGFDISENNNTIIVGAPGADVNRGKIYIFSQNANNQWQEVAMIPFSDDEPEIFRYVSYGYNVILSDGYAYVAAINDDINGIESVGSISVLDVGGGQDCNLNEINDSCETDCNLNGLHDDCDIADGTSDDCNLNGIPDECEPDCNLNSVADGCDIAESTSTDCNENTIPDECEIADNSAIDCNENLFPDECDIALGTSLDCDSNEIPDDCTPSLICDVIEPCLLKTPRINSNREFGHSVSMSNKWAVITSSGFDVPNQEGFRGYSFIFNNEDNQWFFHSIIVPHDTIYSVGQSSSIYNDTIVNGGLGRVFVHTWNGVDWVQEAELEAPSEIQSNLFSDSVSIHGDTMVIGSKGRTRLGKPLYNANIVVYNKIDGIWVNTDIIPRNTPWDRKVLYDGNRIYSQDTGSVSILIHNGTSWIEQARLIPWDSPSNVEFGQSFSYDNGRLAVGATTASSSSNYGAVYVYKLNDQGTPQNFSDDVWEPEDKLTIHNQTEWEHFGNAVSVQGDHIAVGADKSPVFENWSDGQGAIYLYQWNTQEWLQKEKLFEPEGVQFGFSTTMSNGWLFTGAILSDSGYFYGVGGDCNANNIADMCDIVEGTSNDDDNNGIPDECPDCNSNFVPDDEELANGSAKDCNDNAFPDDCDIESGTSADCNSNMVPDECDPDCNGNFIPDDCDLTFGTSLDCNENNIPDECEPDCNGNFVPDDCDLTLGNSTDCNENKIPDECDIEAGSKDFDLDTLPDECKALNRYISVTPIEMMANAGLNVADGLFAIRVTLSELDGFEQFNGQVRWLGPSQTYSDNSNNTNTFQASQLQCEPHFSNWNGNETFAFGADVVPNSVYAIQVVDELCPDLNDPACYSAAQMITTARWGDVVAPFAATGLSQPDIGDVLSLVRRWLGSSTPSKTHAQLQNNITDPSQEISVDDVLVVVNAWLGGGYPFAGPTSCSP